MKYLLLLLVIPALSASECGKKKEKAVTDNETNQVVDSTTLPVCLQQLIDNAKKEDPPNLPEQVDVYLYKGNKVYLVTAPCCDFFNLVYDDSCKTICAPSGGITGRGDGRCPDFDSVAKLVKQIWKKPSK
jgi:hypothetical protein